MEIQTFSHMEHGEAVAQWWAARHKFAWQPAMLSPVGVVGVVDGQPVCACWLYLSMGVGVAYLENPLTKPGTTLAQARQRLRMLFAALEEVAKAHDYGVVICHALTSGVKFMESLGYAFHPFTYATGTKLLR